MVEPNPLTDFTGLVITELLVYSIRIERSKRSLETTRNIALRPLQINSSTARIWLLSALNILLFRILPLFPVILAY